MIESELPIPIIQNDLLRLFKWHKLVKPVPEPRCQMVGAGGHALATAGEGYLTVSPGAGVGVALYDPVSGVGGISHFILAEPPSEGEEGSGDFYVCTGLLQFIDALAAKGARRENLKAAVAGGSALAETLSVKDVDLGLKTVDAALEILQQQRIAVAASETGGLRQHSLLLDTGSWTTSIKLIGASERLAMRTPVKPTRQDLEAAIAAAKPIPQVALQIIRLLGEGGDADFSDLAEEIKRDQVVTSKVLRYSNSALFNPLRNIDSIERALLLLGENKLLEIAASTAAELIYSGQEGGYALMRGGLYRHALAAAHTAKEIATYTGLVDPGTAYTGGLVHDIGKVVLDPFVAGSLPLFYQQQQQVDDLIELERKFFAVDHMTAGQKLAEEWRLPNSLADCICYHHEPHLAAEDHRPLVHIIYLADLLASQYLAGMEMEQIGVASLSERLALLNLKFEQLPGIIAAVPWNKLMYT